MTPASKLGSSSGGGPGFAITIGSGSFSSGTSITRVSSSPTTTSLWYGRMPPATTRSVWPPLLTFASYEPVATRCESSRISAFGSVMILIVPSWTTGFGGSTTCLSSTGRSIETVPGVEIETVFVKSW